MEAFVYDIFVIPDIFRLFCEMFDKDFWGYTKLDWTQHQWENTTTPVRFITIYYNVNAYIIKSLRDFPLVLG